MPLLKIHTNLELSEADFENLMKQSSALVAELLNKSEQYVMIEAKHNNNMLFAGSQEPLAYMELKSIGLDESKTQGYAESLCDFVERTLNISKSRIYIEFANAQRHMWGWNSKTF